MINLIPPDGHKTLRNEYLIRVGTVYSFFLSGVLLVSAVMLIPTNVLLESQFLTMSSRVNAEGSDEAQYATADHTIRDANVTIAQLSIPLDTTLASAVIDEVRKAATGGITFSLFQTKHESGGISSLEVQGVATSRTTLAAFKTALEEEPNIASAEVPISDLARDSNLPFVINVVFKK